MKKLKYNLLILLVLQVLIAAKPVQAENFEAKKEYHKNYPVTANTSLDITNKYGDITIKDWDKNEISIDVIIKVTSSTKEKAEKKIKNIDVVFTEENGTIKAVTEIDENFNNNAIFTINVIDSNSKNQSFSIDYVINMPKDLKLKLKNKYGDIFINNIQGKSTIVLKYGNLKANKMMFDDSKPLSTISLAYSDANIINSNWIEMTADYSDISIDNNTALILASKYSDIKVGKSVAVVCNSKYDDYKLGNIGNFVTTSKYTDFKIDELADKFDVDCDYGDIKVKVMKSDFTKIKIITKYTDVSIPLSKNSNYTIKGNIKYGDIKLNSGFEKLNKSDESFETIVDGVFGKDGSQKATITIRSEYGDIDLAE